MYRTDPVAGITHQVILTELPGQELHVEVLDKDMDMKDDFMGRCSKRLISKVTHDVSTNELEKLFLSSLITFKNVQIEGESEGDHRLSVHRSGGFRLCFLWMQTVH